MEGATDNMIIVTDNVIPEDNLKAIVDGTFESGYGAWKPAKAAMGHKVTPGMNWQGMHAPLHIAVRNAMETEIFPNHSFFKSSTKDDNYKLIHSDLNDGNWTAIVYLSDHSELSGTAFYRHIETGLIRMPTVAEMVESGTAEKWNSDMHDESKWEQLDFVRGLYGRMLVFDAPLFHGRIPQFGFGDTYETGRIVWVCHYFIKEDFQ